MPLPLLGGLLLAGLGKYGLDEYSDSQNQQELARKSSILDKALGSQGWQQQGPQQSGAPMDNVIGKAGLLSRDTDMQTQAISTLLGAGVSSQEISSLLTPLSKEAAAAQANIRKPTSAEQNLAAAGLIPGTEQYQSKMMDYMMKPQVQIGGGAGSIWTPEQVAKAGLAPDTVVTVDKSGKPQILAKEKYSQAVLKDAGFAVRMQTANSTFAEIGKNFPDFDPSSARFHSNLALPNWLSSAMRTPQGQQYKQAQDNWISANLRKESGAVLGAEEIEQEREKWFPAYGNSPEVIAQKERARKDAENSMQKSGGGAFTELSDKAARDRLAELKAKHGIK